eukprot:COSAG01_NODE_7930_length_2987_cov_100.025277_1_plen_67_part_00
MGEVPGGSLHSPYRDTDNFYFGRESILGATIGAMAKLVHDTNRHKFSYELDQYGGYVSGLIVVLMT